MDSHVPTRRELNLLPIAVAFESSLGLVGLLCGWLLGVPWNTLFSERQANAVAILRSLGIGALAALPMIGLLLVIYFHPVGPLRKLSDDVKNQVAPLFQDLSIWALALIALVAGVGEELLCRWCIQGAMQTWLPGPLNWMWALLFASAIFGMGHWLNTHYAIYAFLAGLYLGGLWIWTSDLLVPVTVHTLYDFCALLLLRFPTTSTAADHSRGSPGSSAL